MNQINGHHKMHHLDARNQSIKRESIEEWSETCKIKWRTKLRSVISINEGYRMLEYLTGTLECRSVIMQYMAARESIDCTTGANQDNNA